jgi:gp16 family phage-associated protein
MTRRAKKASPTYRMLRAALIEAGFTVSSWARANGYPPTTVFDAAKGTRAGVETMRIRRKLKELVYG